MKTPKFLNISILSLILIAALIFPAPAMAQGITIEDTVKEGEVVDHNLILSGPTVKMDGTVEGDLLAIGDQIKINGDVDGNLVVLGNQVLLNGAVSGSVYIGAAALLMGPEASVGRDVAFIGGMFETKETSAIARDLNVITLDANLTGETGRDVNALVGPLRLGLVIFDFMKSQGFSPVILLPYLPLSCGTVTSVVKLYGPEQSSAVTVMIYVRFIAVPVLSLRSFTFKAPVTSPVTS